MDGERSLQFNLGKGTFVSQKFKGRMEGNSLEGTVQVSLFPDEFLSMKLNNGKLQVFAPANHGVALNILTQEGEIYGPNYLKIYRDGTQKILRSRLKGDVSKSSIFVRSQEGHIFIK